MTSTGPTESAGEIDAPVTSAAERDSRARPTAANLDNLPTELLLAIPKAFSESWDDEVQILASMAQLNRRLATMLSPETRRTFCVWSGRQLETLCALPEATRVLIKTLFIEVLPTPPDGQQPAKLTDPWRGVLPEAVLRALQLCPAVTVLRMTFLGGVMDPAKETTFQFPLLLAHDSPFNRERAISPANVSL